MPGMLAEARTPGLRESIGSSLGGPANPLLDAVASLPMHVRFGLHGDGLDFGVAGTTVGQATVGPRGLLRLLESDLGVAPAVAHPAEDAARYRECLAKCDDRTRFYHRSFKVDPVGTARTLLDWRQQWYLHGWDGAFPPQASARLADMAAVESIAANQVAPCAGQRLRRVLQLLNEQRTQIRALQLLDHLDDLPPLWRRLAERLGGRPLADPAPAAHPESDLGKLQALLTGKPQQSLRGDGSLVVVRALSRDLTAQAIAEVVRQQRNGSATIVASRDGIVLDNAFERVGLPRAGFQHYSPFRAASQVLKLALALLWEPLDPHRLLQFLIHPVGPLKWKVRTRLAEAVAAEPGIDGPAWQDALKALEEDQDAVAFWTMPRRHPVREGAPAEVLRERAWRCAKWLRRQTHARQTDESAAVYRAALAQAEAFARAVERRVGGEPVAKIEVDRLVDEATRSLPDDSTFAFAEAGHAPAVVHPGNVVAPVDDVLWWDIAPLRLNLQPVFSPAEQRELAAAGVRLPTPEQTIASAARAWQRPVLNCRRRLVLVVHDEGEGRHPLWARIAYQLKSGWQEARLDDALLRGKANAAEALRLALAPLPLQALPGKRRWWKLPRSIPPREVESYSSLSKAYYHPHQWVLNYHAKLGGSRISGVSDDSMLYGNLAHRLFERFFKDNQHWRAMDKGDVDRWLRRVIADLIEKEGAVLLEHGRGVDRQYVEITLEDTLHRLLAHLREASVQEVRSEHPVERDIPGGQLQGSVDLLLLAEDGTRAVLEAKWSREKFREDEIKHGRHLQLATYGFALSANDWPSSGYYIVTTGNVLAPSADFFRRARSPADVAVVSAETVWRRSLVTRDWRLKQLARGEIEVNAGAEPDADSEPPAGGLDTLVDPDRFDDFKWLTGIEPSQ